MKWYKHDSTANIDDKLQEVLLDYGFEGYGLYWYCLEMIAFGVDAENMTFELKHDARIIAKNGGCSVKKVEEIMTKFITLGLFENNSDGRITCLKLAKRADDYTSKLVKEKPLQVIESKGCPTNSDKLRESPPRVDKIRLDKNKKKQALSAAPTVRQVVDLYHEMLPTLPKVEKITKAREGNVKQRIREDLPDIDQWGNYYYHISQSPWLMGRVEGTNGRKPFRADFGWIIKPENFTKIAEDKYHGV